MAEISRWLKKAVKIKASDLHLSSGSPPFLRLLGKIRHVKGEDELTPEKTIKLIKEIMPSVNAKEFEETYDTDFAHELEGVPFADMAEMWNIPLNTLLSHKSRAMRKLKQIFQNS